MLHYLVIFNKKQIDEACSVHLGSTQNWNDRERVSMAAAQMTDSGSILYFWKDGSAI